MYFIMFIYQYDISIHWYIKQKLNSHHTKRKQHFNLDNVWERNVEADRGEANTGHQPVQQTTGMADHWEQTSVRSCRRKGHHNCFRHSQYVSPAVRSIQNSLRNCHLWTINANFQIQSYKVCIHGLYTWKKLALYAWIFLFYLVNKYISNYM